MASGMIWVRYFIIKNLDRGQIISVPNAYWDDYPDDPAPTPALEDASILMTEVGTRLTDLLTVYNFPPPRHTNADELYEMRETQLPHSTLLHLPQELIDNITSYLVPCSSAPDVAPRSRAGVQQAADLTSLALTCRFYLAVLHPVVREMLRNGAAAPWAGDRIRVYRFVRQEPAALGAVGNGHVFAPDLINDESSGSAAAEVFRRLEDEEGGRCTGCCCQVFKERVLGLQPEDAARRRRCRHAGGAAYGEALILRNMDRNTYVRELDLQHWGVRCPLGELVTLRGLWMCGDDWKASREYAQGHRFDIRRVGRDGRQLPWTDVVQKALYMYEHQRR